MGSDLIAWVVAIAFGIAVVVLGLRRNLSETTRNGLPRYGEPSERATPTLGLYKGGARRRRPLSPREKRRMALLYLLFGLGNAALGVLGGDVVYVVLAALWALAGVWWLKR